MGHLSHVSYITEAIPSQAMAFAKPNIYHEHFLAALAHYAGRKMHQFEAREVSNALWSFTILRKNIVSPQWSLGEVDQSFWDGENLRLEGSNMKSHDVSIYSWWVSLLLLREHWAGTSSTVFFRQISFLYKDFAIGLGMTNQPEFYLLFLKIGKGHQSS